MKYLRVLLFTVLAVCSAMQVEAATASWDRNPEADVTGYRLSYGTQTGVHDVSFDVGNVITVPFSPPAGRRYYIVVQAYTSAGTLSPKSAEVIYDAPATQNQPPVLTQPANQSTTQNTSQSLQLIASDPEGTALTFGASGLPPGIAINAATGVIAGTPTTVGTYTVIATASDGSLTASRTFTWTVTAATGATTLLLAPTDTTLNINTTNYASDQLLHTYTYPANRVANAILMKFNLSQLPANAVIQSATLQLSLLYADSVTTDPNYSVSLHQIINRNPDLTRATGSTADGVVAWTASTCCYQNIPLAQADISPARAVTAVNRTLGVKTWDALSIVQAWRTAPATNYGLLLNSDTTKGADRYRFFASMENPSTSQRPSLRIVYTVPTQTGDTTPPSVAMTSPANAATVSGANVSVAASASDAVGVVGVQFRLDGANLGAEDTVAPYAVVWNTTTASNASHVLTAVARDAAGNSRTATAITVTVNNTVANRAPTLAQPANRTSAEASPVSLALSGSDPDGNPLTYTATGLPGGLSVNASSGLISGTPSYTSAGSYTVTARVSDGSLSQSRTFSWTITNTNRKPKLTAPTSQSSEAETAVSLQLVGSDDDGTAVTYNAANLPSGVALNSSTGMISGTLATDSVGVYTVVVTASDGALSESQTFVWSVDGSDAPIRGDFDGDGKNDPATYRASPGHWRIWLSANNFAVIGPISWGAKDDIPVPADYDGDRRTDIAVYRPSTGRWHVLLSSTNMQTTLDIQWGDANDRPLPIDYDNDGKADLALPRFGGFEILLSGSNYTESIKVK